MTELAMNSRCLRMYETMPTTQTLVVSPAVGACDALEAEDCERDRRLRGIDELHRSERAERRVDRGQRRPDRSHGVEEASG